MSRAEPRRNSESAGRFAPSVCPHDCPSVCALDVEVLDDQRIGRVRGSKRQNYTAGVICAKVARYAERVHHPDRLMRPLRRRPRGAGFEPVSWDDALDEIASRFAEIAEHDGPEAIWPYHYAGTMGLVQRDGIERFRRAFGTSRQHSTFCTSLPDAGWLAGAGEKRGSDPRNIEFSDLVVVWGGNPVSTQVNLMHHIARARRERGARLIVVDPYRTKTAEKADRHLMVRPGTDGALACAVMHVLFKEDLADRDYLERYTDQADRLERHLQARDPAWAAGITGLAVEEIVAFAREYGSTRRSFLRLGYGFARSRNGAVNMHAASCLPAITGAWQEKGGGALYGNGVIYPLDRTLIQGLDLPADARLIDQSRIGAALNGEPADLKGGPPIRALFIQNTNPVVVAPESRRVLAGLEREDLFTVVHEQFITDTARQADLVLPATMFLEHDDLYQASGHTFLQVGQSLIEPPGECRSNHRVLCSLAERLNLVHAGFRMSEAELIDATLARSGLPSADEIVAMDGFDCAPGFETGNFLDGFPTPSRRFRLAPDWASVGPHSAGMPTLPDHWASIDAPSETYPLRLVAAPARQFLNTSFTETDSARRMEKRPEARMHPDDLAAYGIGADGRVQLGNALGEIELDVASFSGVQRGTVVVESLWPNTSFAGGLGINTLISADPGQPNGGAVYHDTAVWARPVASDR